MNVFSESFHRFSQALPILSPAEIPPPRKAQRGEKYGGLFYVGIGGIVLMVLMVGWFAYGFLESARRLGWGIYVLHDRGPPGRRPSAGRGSA